MTGTIQYDLWKNVLSRLEIRWDHAADNRDYYGGPTPGTAISAANDQFLKQNSFLVAANLIYKF